MKKLLVPLMAFLLSTTVTVGQEKKETLCLPFKEMTNNLSNMGFLPLFGTNNEKTGTMVFVQGEHKALAIVVFDTGGNSCLATIQENLRLHNENYEAITSGLIGKRA